MADTLTPKLNAAQLKQNIDALQKQGVATDKIQAYVNNYKSDGAGGYVLASSAPAQPAAPAPADNIITKTNAHAASIVGDLSGKPGFTPALDVIGNVAGEVGDFFGEGLKAIVPQPIKDALSGATKVIAGTPAAKSVLDAWNKFQAQHPDAAKNIGNAVNIAALFGGGEAAKAAEPVTQGIKEGVVNASKSAAETVSTSLAERAAQKEADSVWEVIKPNLTGKEADSAVKSGTLKAQGLLRTVTQIPKGDDLKMIEVAKPYVVDAKTPDVAVFNMQKGIAESARKVRTGLESSDAIWNKNELKSTLNGIQEPLTVKSDATLHNTFNNFKRAVLQIADKASKKTVGILDTRQGLDKLIEEELGPTIYDKSNPLSKVVRDFRSTLNDFAESKIPDGKLPDGSGFKAELKKQSLLYRAIDNTAPKVGKEGENIIKRWAKANPLKAKALKYGATAAIGGEIINHTGL